jgi:multiple sugar transport system substrate-binding protein
MLIATFDRLPAGPGRGLRRHLLATGAAFALTAGLAQAQNITVWSGYPELAPFYEHVAEGLKATHPGITVDVQAIPLREHERRVALGLASGSGGNVVIELPRSTATRYIENDLITPAPDAVAAFVSDPQNFNAFFVDAASSDGTVYGVPLFRGQSALFYNTDMFAAAGLDGPPATMEEYTDYAMKLTQSDGSGIPTVTGWSLRLSGGGQGIAEKFWINMFQFGGGNMFEEVAPGAWRVNMTSEAAVKALTQYIDNVHVNRTVTLEAPADADAFQRGQTAMFIRESWVIGDTAAKAPDLNYATANLPYGAIALPANLYVSAEGDGADAAWTFAQATNDPENLVWLLANVGWLPNRQNVDYSSVTDAQPAFAGFLDHPEDYQFFTLPALAPIEELLTRIAGGLTSAWGDASLAGNPDGIVAALKVIEDEANAILAREGLLAQ